jgi:hypothetical protein
MRGSLLVNTLPHRFEPLEDEIMVESLPVPLEAFVTATNAADNETFLEVFAEDAYLRDWGREFHGRDGIARWNRTDNIGKRAHFAVLDVSITNGGAGATLTVDVSGNGFNGVSDLEFRLADGQITSLIIG